MNRRVSPILVKLEEARLARNVNLEEIGSLRKDKGYAQFLDAPTSDTVLSLYPFYKIGSSTTRYLLRDSGGVVYQKGTTTWDALSGATGLSTSAVPAWVTYKNLALRFNGTDNPKKWDGTTFGDLGGTPPNGTIAALYKDRVYQSGVSPNFSTVYFSETGNPENWPGFNNFDVNANDGDRVIALEPLFDSLMIFKEFSIWEFQVDPKNNPATLRYVTLDVGTTSRRSIVNIGGIVYFFNRRGVYQFASRYPELISLKVQDFIDAVADPYAVVAFKTGNKYNLFIGTVTVGGRTYTNCTLVYDTLQDAWTVKTLAHAIKAVGDFIETDNVQRTYFGSTAGKTFQWDSGYKYDTVPIEVEFETGTIELGDPRTEHDIPFLLVRSGRLPKSPATLHYSVDGEDWREAGKIEDTFHEFPIDERGRDIALRFHEVSSKEMREVYKVEIYVGDTPTGERTKKAA